MAGFKWLVFVFLMGGFLVGVGLWWLGFVFLGGWFLGG